VSEEFYEYLNGLIFRHAEFVVKPCRILGPVFCPLPEFTGVIARERDNVLLGYMPVYGVTFLDDLVRAERYGHVDLAELPFHPCPSVKPYVAFLEPCLVLELLEGFKHGFRTYPVCPVRVCKVSGKVYLVWLYLLEKVDDDVDILLGPFPFLDSARLVERKVEEMGICILVKSE